MPAPQQERASTGHRVHIRVGDGGFHYARPDGEDAARIVVRKGDQVTWHCDHGNYSVLFKSESPFGEIAFHGRKGHETGSALVVSEKGSFHYGVTVSLDSGLSVDDPEIIVDDSGT